MKTVAKAPAVLMNSRDVAIATEVCHTLKAVGYNAIATEFRTLLAQDSCAFLDGQAAGLLPIGSLPSASVAVPSRYLPDSFT